MNNEQFNQMDVGYFIPDDIKNVRNQVFLENKDIIYDLGYMNMEFDSLKNYYYSSFGFI